jgi:prolyl 4-hydroxylase
MIKDFDFIAESSHKDPENFIGNPVNALLLIKKLTKDLQRLVDTLNTYAKLKVIVDEIKEKILLPSSDDYKGSIEAIHRLEDTYLLDPADIARGNLSQKHVSRPLTGNFLSYMLFVVVGSFCRVNFRNYPCSL